MSTTTIWTAFVAATITLWSARAHGDTRIPLCAGLTIGGAVSEPRGDYEPLVRVESVTAQSLTLAYSSQTATPSGSLLHTNARRVILLDDLRSATMLVRWFSPSAPLTIRGSTAIGLSTAALRALKTKGVAEVALVDRSNSSLRADRNTHPNIYDAAVKYKLQRVGTQTERIPVTVNDQRVELPAIHAAGESFGDRIEFFILDDEDNPMGLRSRSTTGGKSAAVTESQVVRLSFRCHPTTTVKSASTTVNRIEQALLTSGRADVYDLYFDFNSANLRPESEATLTEIADLMRRHPDWKLGIEGHTDNIAGDAYNLDLSRRRAASVRTALTTKYRIEAARLASEGYGESRPKDRNDTLEGRARNRRVELARH